MAKKNPGGLGRGWVGSVVAVGGLHHSLDVARVEDRGPTALPRLEVFPHERDQRSGDLPLPRGGKAAGGPLKVRQRVPIVSFPADAADVVGQDGPAHRAAGGGGGTGGGEVEGRRGRHGGPQPAPAGNRQPVVARVGIVSHRL